MLDGSHYSCTCHTQTINILMAFTILINSVIRFYFRLIICKAENCWRIVYAMTLQFYEDFLESSSSQLMKTFKIHDVKQHIFHRFSQSAILT